MLRVRHYPFMWSEREVKEDLHLKLEAKSYKKQKVSYPRAVSKKKKKRKDEGRGRKWKTEGQTRDIFPHL